MPLELVSLLSVLKFLCPIRISALSDPETPQRIGPEPESQTPNIKTSPGHPETKIMIDEFEKELISFVNNPIRNPKNDKNRSIPQNVSHMTALLLISGNKALMTYNIL